MPRCFLHLHNDIIAIDEEGSDWAGDGATMEAVLDSAREMVSVREGRPNRNHYVDVIAENGRSVGRVTFADAVKVLAE